MIFLYVYATSVMLSFFDLYTDHLHWIWEEMLCSESAVLFQSLSTSTYVTKVMFSFKKLSYSFFQSGILHFSLGKI